MKKTIPAVLLYLIGAAAAFGADANPDTAVHRIFILHSYEEDHICGQPQHDGALAVLKESGFIEDLNLVIGFYFMDTKRVHNTPEQIEQQGRIALQKIADFRPDILITLDDNAFKTAGLALADSELPVVFSGLNGQPETYHQQTPFMDSRKRPGHNITGVYEKLHIQDAIRVHTKLFPDTEKILFITDTSTTGSAVSQQIRIELNEAGAGAGSGVRWVLKSVSDWKEYRNAVSRANEDPAVGGLYPAALLLKDEQGVTRTAPEIFAWTAANSRKPEIAINFAFTKLGLFGGASVDFYAMGRQVGKMAARILNCEPAGNIPIEEAERYALTFNLKRAKQLGITLPDDILLAADEVIQ